MIAVGAISNLMAPTMRDIRLGEDQVSDVEQQAFVTSTPAANPPVSLGGGDLQEDGPDIFATPVPTNTPVGTIIPDAPEPVSCPRDSAWFHIPGNGQLIYEATTAIGTANVSNFSFYRFEIKLQGADTQFRKFGDDHTEPMVDGPLGEIAPLNLPNGEYRLRLTVFDNTEMLRASCEITIYISDPPLTPTPIGASAATPTPEAS